jgi:ubiquinone/menaquinone biosynthesis C-methylase UbiE
MATNWRKAQENEIHFWRSIYIQKQKDIPTYMPITDDAALAFTKKSVERFGHTLDIIDDKVAIDVGCGPYGLIRGFQVNAQKTGNEPKKMYGVDSLIDTYLEFGTLPTSPYIEYIKAKAESIPLADGSCDYVFSTNVIDHVEYPERVLQECHRICKNTGVVLFAVHIVKFPFNLLGPLLFLIDKNHPHHFDEKNILQLAQKYFPSMVLKRKISILEDHPEFTFLNIFRSENKLRSLKRWLSTFLLSSYYFQCGK